MAPELTIAPALELVNRIGVDVVYNHDALANRFRVGLGSRFAHSARAFPPGPTRSRFR